ncbi:MAG: hypothetical protein AAFO95_19445, partial [Cyanobacteria bacterium J06600_6]
ATINDTCANCNNKLLGDLDNYAKTVLQKSGVFTSNFLSDLAILEYEYSLFERWLLKVSFNSARANRNAQNIFEQHIPYILGKQLRSDKIFVFAAIHKPAKLTQAEMFKYQGLLPFDSNGLSNPFFVRIMKSVILDDDFVVRPIILGSFLFLIVLFNHQHPSDYKIRKVTYLLNKYPKMQAIEPSSSSIRLAQMSLTFSDTQKNQACYLQQLGVL